MCEKHIAALIEWLVAFDHDRHIAHHFCPLPVYIDLVDREFLTIHHDVTPKGREFIEETVFLT